MVFDGVVKMLSGIFYARAKAIVAGIFLEKEAAGLWQGVFCGGVLSSGRML